MDVVQSAAAINTVAPIRPISNTEAKTTTDALTTSNLNLQQIQDIVRENKTGQTILSVPDKALATAIEHINKVVSGANIELRHSIHKPTNTVIVTLVDKDTSDVILEIPPEKVLDAYVERMTLNGLYLDERR